MGCYPPCEDGCDATCDAQVTWTPNPERRRKWPSGRVQGFGLKVESVDEATGSMVLLARSKTTLRWTLRVNKKAHGA